MLGARAMCPLTKMMLWHEMKAVRVWLHHLPFPGITFPEEEPRFVQVVLQAMTQQKVSERTPGDPEETLLLHLVSQEFEGRPLTGLLPKTSLGHGLPRPLLFDFSGWKSAVLLEL